MMDIVTFSAADIETHLVDLALLIKDAIDHGASMSYLPPLEFEVSCEFWEKTGKAVLGGEQVVLAAFENGQPVGSVQLALAWQPNGRHRAEVQKLMVHTAQRRRGIASQLMLALEAVAIQHQRTLLVLDTLAGGGAEQLYEQLGYQRVGEIPYFAIVEDGSTQPTVFFYKVLRASTTS